MGAKDCTKEDVCYVCNKEGHLAKDCPDQGKKTCYRCSGKGHIAMDCPSSQRDLDRVRKRNDEDKEAVVFTVLSDSPAREENQSTFGECCTYLCCPLQLNLHFLCEKKKK